MGHHTPFFVTGLPRSRTAWLANWLTTDRSLCYHDAPFDSELCSAGRHVGFSGPELAEDFDRIAAEEPTARWLVVLRPSQDCFASFVRWAGALLKSVNATPESLIIAWKSREKAVAKICLHSTAFVIDYKSMDEPNLRTAWRHILPEIPFDSERFKVLNGLNVQQDIGKNKERLSQWQSAQ
jgi:hypothetical protein